jgi:hypothetical protein
MLPSSVHAERTFPMQEKNRLLTLSHLIAGMNRERERGRHRTLIAVPAPPVVGLGFVQLAGCRERPQIRQEQRGTRQWLTMPWFDPVRAAKVSTGWSGPSRHADRTVRARHQGLRISQFRSCCAGRLRINVTIVSRSVGRALVCPLRAQACRRAAENRD